MSSNFFRTGITDDNFIRGAARLLVAGTTIAFPTTIGDVVNLSTFDAQTGWTDVGATKTGITVTRNNTEEVFDVDQIIGDIDSRPVSYEQTIATALAEVTLENIQLAWEGGGIDTSGGFRTMGVGEPATYTRKRLAVIFQKANGKLRMHAFHKVQRSAQESALAYNKTGEQQSTPVVFRALADTSIADVNRITQVIFDQV
jgi:hypothetical protein